MRILQDLNRLEISQSCCCGKLENIIQEIKITSFDISPLQPKEYNLLYLDCKGNIIYSNENYDFSISIDLATDNESDINADNLEDLKDVEFKIQRAFNSETSELRKLILNHIIQFHNEIIESKMKEILE